MNPLSDTEIRLEVVKELLKRNPNHSINDLFILDAKKLESYIIKG